MPSSYYMQYVHVYHLVFLRSILEQMVFTRGSLFDAHFLFNGSVLDAYQQTVALWLRAHRSVHIVTRDRAGAYSEGIQQGAPQAIQVADRWHLLKNLGDALERLMNRCPHDLRQTAQELEQADVAVAPMMPAPAQPSQSQRRARRLSRYKQVVRYHRRFVSLPVPQHWIGALYDTG